jgi:predicted nucleotidyltransferase
MAGLTKKEWEALQIFKQRTEAALPEQVESLYVFGSKARGDADKHSDIDVLVVMKDASGGNRSIVSGVASQVLTETGVLVSAKKFTPGQIAEMEKRKAIFWQTIKPELKPI